MNEFTNWAALVTLPGAIVAVLLIVQYTKSWVPAKFDTKLYVLLWSLVLTQAAAFMLGWAWQEHVLMIINAVAVAAGAMGSYDQTFRKSDEAKTTITRGPII